MNRNRLTAMLLTCLLATSVAAQSGGAGADDPQRLAAAERYQMEQWPSGVRHAGLDLSQVNVPGLQGQSLEFLPHSGQVTRLYKDLEGRPALRVEMVVTDRSELAHQLLLDHIAFVSGTKMLPRTEERQIAAGDIGFVGHAGVQQDQIAWIAFAQGNIEVRVLNMTLRSDEPMDVEPFAETLSAAITEAPELAEGPLPAPRVERLSTDKAACAMGDVLPLDVRAVQPDGSAARLRFEVGGTAQGYVEQGPAGRWHFHATKDGQALIPVHALADNGTMASRQVKLLVER